MSPDLVPGTPDGRTGLERMRALLEAGYSSGIVGLLGLRAIDVAPGTTTFSGTPGEAHYNGGGTVHGGYLTTLLDTAMGCAAITVLPAGLGVTTIELKVMFQRAVTVATGVLLARGGVLSHGRRVVFTEARLTDASGRLLATASSSLLVLAGQRGEGG